MNIYAIMYGFYSSLEGAQYDCFFSTKQKANVYLKHTVKNRGLKRCKNKKTGKFNGSYSDGDYYIYIIKIQLDEFLP